MAVHKKQRLAHNHPDSAMKENVPAIKAKKTVNIESLFDQSRSAAKHNNASPLHNVETSDAKAKNRNHQHSTSAKSKVYHPAFLQFADATQKYQDALEVAKAGDLQPVHDALVARVDGLTLHGKPLTTPGVVAIEDIEARGEEEQTLCASIDDTSVKAKVNHGDNYEIRDVKLGDTLQAFKQAVESAYAEASKLAGELDGIEEEIVAAREAIVDAEENEVKKADKALLNELSSLVEEMGDANNDMENNIKKARKEDQVAKAEMDRKLEQFMREL